MESVTNASLRGVRGEKLSFGHLMGLVKEKDGACAACLFD